MSLTRSAASSTGCTTAADLRHAAPCEFKYSFRSGPNVLAAVNQVFAPKDIFASVTADEGGVPPHHALPEAAPGLVEIWDTWSSPPSEREIEGWDAPFDELTEASPVARLAGRIAKSVATWRRQGIARAGDVLILVRQRGALFEAVIRALKAASIAVAGADRLVLTEHIAVMDLMVLADALLLLEDDLALATALKSPLFGLDDDALFDLAWDRKGSLRAAMREQRPELAARLDALAEAAHERLHAIRVLRANCSAPAAAERKSCRGSATRPTTRSMNSSISRSTTSVQRRRRCRASSRGCDRPRPR